MSEKLYRRNVGIAVFNRVGEVLIAERKDIPGAWQLPQGGIDDGEDPWPAALRELEEEIGTRQVSYLGEIEAWQRYDFPASNINKRFEGKYSGQEQKWFAVRYDGDEADIDLQASTHHEFSAWKWAPLYSIPELIVDFKRPIYNAIVEHFSQFAAEER